MRNIINISLPPKMAEAVEENVKKGLFSSKSEFFRMLQFVQANFPDGFRKNASHNSVPRVRFEAIAIGTALALRENDNLALTADQIASRMKAQSFDQVVVSGSANVRSKLEGRIEIVRSLLLAAG